MSLQTHTRSAPLVPCRLKQTAGCLARTTCPCGSACHTRFRKHHPPTFSQPRPNTYKLTLPQTALTAEEWNERLAYPEALEEHFEDFPAQLAQLTTAVTDGDMQARGACHKAKEMICDRINAAVAQTIGFGRPRRHPSARMPFVRTRAVRDAVQTRGAAASDLHQVVSADPLNTAAITAAQTQVKTVQASLKQAVVEARQQHTNRLLATVASSRKGNDGKGMWKALKTLAGARDGKRSGPAALRNPHGPGLVTDGEGICEILATHYESVSSTSTHYRNGDFDPQHRAAVEAQVKQYREQLSFSADDPGSLSRPIPAEEVLMQSSNLNNDKAPSPLDNIYNELLKYGGSALAGHLASFFQMQFELEVKAKACGVIIPIYKKADPTEPKNYRPITLGSAVDKLYNLVLNARIMTFLEDNNLLHDGQQGFRPGRSSVDAYHRSARRQACHNAGNTLKIVSWTVLHNWATLQPQQQHHQIIGPQHSMAPRKASWFIPSNSWQLRYAATLSFGLLMQPGTYCTRSSTTSGHS